ncbi:hypothetical protein GBA52_012406 [Prunus armeniaca]|nr:hypothetical protein GBA52_012406 [Prunus armeniaca]
MSVDIVNVRICEDMRISSLVGLWEDFRGPEFHEESMQSQLVCSGCRSILLYPRGATNVCCALCNIITPVPPPVTLISGVVKVLMHGQTRCRLKIEIMREDFKIRISLINLPSGSRSSVVEYPEGNLVELLLSFEVLSMDVVNAYTWGNKCEVLLLSYCKSRSSQGILIPPPPQVKMKKGKRKKRVVTDIHMIDTAEELSIVSMTNMRVPIPVHRPNGTANSGMAPSTSAAMPHSQSQTVVVENPMSVDESGKLVSNVVVGVTTGKK